MIYLDYNATTPTRPEAIAAMTPWLAGGYNPSSLHKQGREARAAIEKARRTLGDALGIDPSGIIFTASGTEANNQALHCLGATELLVAASEHAAILKAAQALENRLPVRILPVGSSGLLDRKALEAALQDCTTDRPLVSVMLANNETGLIQPIAAIADLVHQHRGLLHVDACQAIGKIAFQPADLGADAYTIASHKLGGPVGAAALATVTCRPVGSLLVGGGQELNRRAGTENIPAIIGFAKAVELAVADLPDFTRRAAWRDAMEAELLAAVPAMHIFCHEHPRLPNTSNLTMPGVENSTQLMHFDLEGIAVSSGSACTSGKVEASHVLSAMGVPKAIATTAIRVSFGWASTQADLHAFTQSWLKLYRRTRKS